MPADELPFEPAALLGEFRRRTVLVPLVDGGLMSAEQAEPADRLLPFAEVDSHLVGHGRPTPPLGRRFAGASSPRS